MAAAQSAIAETVAEEVQSDATDADFLSLGHVGREKYARDLIAKGDEDGKVDFKSALPLAKASDKAEFAKDVSAIANTDSNRRRGYGFLVVGAKAKEVVGGVEQLKGVGPDKFGATLQQLAADWIAPAPEIDLVAFEDSEKGWWGVIVVRPSDRQPHVMIKDAGNGMLHEVFVRIGQTSSKARAHDYGRFIENRIRSATTGLDFQLRDQGARLHTLEQSPGKLESIVAALRSEAPVALVDERQVSAATIVRQRLMSKDDEVDEAITREALRVAAFTRTDPSEPIWNGRGAEAWREATERLENETRPLVEALATVVCCGSDEAAGNLARKALNILGSGATQRTFEQDIRLYPLVLCVYSVAFVAVQMGRGAVLRQALAARFQVRWQDHELAVLQMLFQARRTQNLFAGAFSRNVEWPFHDRVATVVTGWCSEYAPASVAQEAFLEAELVLALAALPLPEYAPLTGMYLITGEARIVLPRFLRRQPAWLSDVIGNPQAALATFDDHLKAFVRQSGFFMDGFTGGALAAWQSGAPAKQG